jgi:hypothetical protein
MWVVLRAVPLVVSKVDQMAVLSAAQKADQRAV